MQKKQTILVVASLLVVVLSVTLAYFTAQIIGKGKSVTINSANLQIIFTDSDGSISGTNIEPGKWNVTKTFTVENKSNEIYKYNIVIQDLVNTFVTQGYLQYKITSTNGGYSTDGYVDVPKSETATDTILAYSASIDVGVIQNYSIEFIYKNDENIDQSDDMGKTLSGKLFIAEGTEEPTLLSRILKDNPTRGTRSDFSTPFTSNTANTLYTAKENNTDVYYYAGQDTESTPINNWVKFGGYYWRIIRTNSDGSIRMLYHGTSATAEDAYIGTSKFNPSGDPMYMGYMYGESVSTDEIDRSNTNNSAIKEVIDAWYKSNLINYTKYLSNDAVYCNDREYIESISTDEVIWYGNYYPSKNPSYNCTDIRDAFSVNNTSAKLDYPIGLMTADEISYAGGGKENVANKAWYHLNSVNKSSTGSQYWWTMTPRDFEYGETCLYLFSPTSTDQEKASLNGNYTNFEHSVRPVISLKSCVNTSGGDGSSENPYTILETETGC